MTRRKDKGGDDDDLFASAMRGVTPLSKPSKPVQKKAPAAAAGDAAPAPDRRRAASRAPSTAAAAPSRPVATGSPAADAAQPGPGLDRRTATRLRRGQLQIDARLDLHGYTQKEAHRKLHAFLDRASRRGQRCVLVITGKGVVQEHPGHGEDARESGVLRRNLPRWLNEAPVRELVLGIEPARPQHGGAGAYYVLLRRQRGEGS